MPKIDASRLNLEETVVQVARVSKVVKGGRRFSFRALVVVGDRAGHVGVGLGKAGEVPEAIRKGVEDAKKHLIEVPLLGTTIPFLSRGMFAASEVLLKPAAPGTGVIAGGAVRAVVEAAGIRDILTKSLGSSTSLNTVMATMDACASCASFEAEAARRGRTVAELVGARRAAQIAEAAAAGRGLHPARARGARGARWRPPPWWWWSRRRPRRRGGGGRWWTRRPRAWWPGPGVAVPVAGAVARRPGGPRR